ncbi:MAG: polysaccharide deacetylase family protein [Bacteroidetes bacterium]|nr:polysaccharide deacetylase family protein [Bacteroidota bacterium]
MILILTSFPSRRLSYTLDIVLKDLLGFDYAVTNNETEFRTDKILEIDPAVASYEGITTLFHSGEPEQLLPFDIFASVFYMLSRYEEYLPFEPDTFGRFPATASLAYKHQFLQKPVVNHWARMLGKALNKLYADLNPFTGRYRFQPTLDIDVAYAYQWKGILRNMGGFARSLSMGRLSDVRERARVLMGSQQDPYDTYSFQAALHGRHSLKPVFFVLFAQYSTYDKNLPVHHPQFKSLIQSLARQGKVGIHPSFASFTRPEHLKIETGRLSQVLGHPVRCSRQHFLLLSMPETYRRLISLGIEEDYTMGFASFPGFRAGICDPFPFYDLATEETTSLTLFPFTVMDGTLKDYMLLDPAQASAVIHTLIEEVKAVNGMFISLWHNESLSDSFRWAHWRQVYEKLVEEASELYI